MVVIREQASDISKLYAVVDAPVDSQCRVRRHHLLPEHGEGLYKVTAAVGGGTANLMATAILRMYVLQRGCDDVERVCASQPAASERSVPPLQRGAVDPVDGHADATDAMATASFGCFARCASPGGPD